MSEFKASVIVNNHNYGRYLADAVDSALVQTWRDTEVVVVDDGSTDESRRLIEGYGSRIRAVLQDNAGQCSALNAGFTVSRGDVIVFLDADDVLEPTAVEESCLALADGTSSQAHWPLLEIDAQGAPTGRLQPPWGLRGGDFLQEAIDAGPVMGLPTQLSANAWPRWYLDRVMPLPEDRRYFGDMYLYTLCAVHGSSTLLDLPLTRYRVHGANDHTAGTARDRFLRRLDWWERLCRLLAEELSRWSHPTPTEQWQQHNPYGRWLWRWSEAVARIGQVVPPGSRYVFADDGNWDGTDLVGNRTAVPFTERGGGYWGPPADDEAGWAELCRQHDRGARYLVLADRPDWWRQSYPRLWSRMVEGFDLLCDEDMVAIFSLDPTRGRG